MLLQDGPTQRQHASFFQMPTAWQAEGADAGSTSGKVSGHEMAKMANMQDFQPVNGPMAQSQIKNPLFGTEEVLQQAEEASWPPFKSDYRITV